MSIIILGEQMFAGRLTVDIFTLLVGCSLYLKKSLRYWRRNLKETNKWCILASINWKVCTFSLLHSYCMLLDLFFLALCRGWFLGFHCVISAWHVVIQFTLCTLYSSTVHRAEKKKHLLRVLVVLFFGCTYMYIVIDTLIQDMWFRMEVQESLALCSLILGYVFLCQS